MKDLETVSRVVQIRIATVVSLLVVAMFTQNCGVGFKVVSSTELSSNSGSGNELEPGPIDGSLDGKVLYAAKCASCHLPLESSTKRGKSASLIKDAISNVANMRLAPGLIALTSAEISAIEDALSGRVAAPVTPIGACLPAAVRGVSKEAVRRLSRDELKASMQSVLPQVMDVVNSQLAFYPDTEIVDDVEKYDSLHSEAQILRWAQIVDSVVETVVARNILGTINSCMQAATITEDCWKDFFTNFGKKVYRRPLDANEIAKLASLSMGQGSSANGIYAAFHMLFRSPSFLFHFERGISDETNRVRLSDYEVANRISFAVLGTPPDAGLWAAADKGELKTIEQVQTHVRRLIESDAAKTKLQIFFGEWLQLNKIQQPQNEFIAFFKNLGTNAGVDRMMRQEILDYVLYVIWKQKGTFKDLMTQPIAFPRFQGWYYGKDGAPPFSLLADVYGGDAFKNFTPENQAEAIPYPAPNNPGLLTRAGFMSSTRWQTEPINRGVFIQRRILCETLPSPDFSIVNQRLNDVGTLDHRDYPNHQITSIQTSGAACVACHSKINPVGFVFESFDTLGKHRTVEEVLDINKFYSEVKGVVATHALPGAVPNVVLGDKTVNVSSAADLVHQVANSSTAKACLSKFVLRHFDRRKENSGDSCAVAEATQVLESNQPVLEVFVRSLANEDIFWRRK